ncbi:MAG: hypothetical protein ACPHRO_03415 [Nannocystaceae bacterium]
MDKYRSLVTELRAYGEVRDVVVSTIKEGAVTLGKFSTCSESESKDIEKTVRRMFAASSTIGSSLRKVTMYLGGSALVAYALNPEDNLILLVESETDVERLEPEVEKFRAAALAES